MEEYTKYIEWKLRGGSKIANINLSKEKHMVICGPYEGLVGKIEIGLEINRDSLYKKFYPDEGQPYRINISEYMLHRIEDKGGDVI